MNYNIEVEKKLKRNLTKFKHIIDGIVQDIVYKEINNIVMYKKVNSTSDISDILKPYVIELSLLVEKRNNIDFKNISFIELSELEFQKEILRQLIITLRNKLGNLYIETLNVEKNDNLLKQSKSNKTSILKHLKKILFH
uniref:Ribosome-binding factor A n=1 Tax=Strongyloides stercoralis TaxID=6248 RepID=A0A0K0EHE9_STRER